ncbi:MAG: NAD(P)-binding domain-containing protein [Alphaproteobacteria bacterium]|nr:NAD(P)-binding domain-containing protein [Rickettsiales bacterium]
MNKIAVIGAGKFGTAMAFACCQNSKNLVYLYSRNTAKVDSINHNGKSSEFPDLHLNIIASSNLAEVILDAEYIFLTVSSSSLMEVVDQIKQALQVKKSNSTVNILLCTKGIYFTDGTLFYSDAIEKIIPEAKIYVLSGPSFASEIVSGVRTSVSVACKNIHDAQQLQTNIFEGSNLFTVPSTDVRGLQILGAFKNVIGIRSGIEEGFANVIFEQVKPINEQHTKVECYNKIAVLMMNLINESRKLLEITGCEKDTIFSLAGMGDILLTCASLKSRNRILGETIGKEMAKIAINKLDKQQVESIIKSFIGKESFISDFIAKENIAKQIKERLVLNDNTIEGIKPAVKLCQYCEANNIKLPELGLTSVILQAVKKDTQI